MKSRGYHLYLIATFLAILMFAPLAQQAWSGWDHFDPNSISTLPFSHITGIAMDDSSLWIGTDQGLVEYNLFSDDPNQGWTSHNTKIDPNYVPISSMDIDQNMVLWLGTQKGLVSYDPGSSGLFIHDGLSFSDPSEIKDVEVDTNFVWVATDQGLNRFHKSSGTWVCYSNDPNGFESPRAKAVASSEDDTIWVLPGGIPEPFGIYRYRLLTNQWDYFSTTAGPGPSEVNFNSLTMGDNNDIWLGSDTFGLWRLEPDEPDPNDKWTREDANSDLPSDSIQAIGKYPGSKHIIVATGNGTDGSRITKYNIDLGLWQPIGIPVSLDLGSQVIKDILVDPDHGQVWFGTEGGELYRWKEETVIWSNPVNSTENVPLDTNVIEVIFNECIDDSSIVLGPPGSSLAFEMTDSEDNPITDPNIYDPDDFTWSFHDPNTNTHLIIEPKDTNYKLHPNTWYSFTFTPGITDCSDEPIEKNTLKFKTLFPPSVVDTDPDPNATNVSQYASIDIWFSKGMDPNSFFPEMLVLWDGEDFPYSVAEGETEFLDSNHLVITISGDPPLKAEKKYTLTVNKNVTDLSGNPLGKEFTFQFTTKTESLKTIPPPEGGWPPAINVDDIDIDMVTDTNYISISAMALNPKDGGLWAGLDYLDLDDNWVGLGLFHFDGNEWEKYMSLDPNCGLSSNKINDLAFDSNNNLWIATEPDLNGSGGGVNMFDGLNWYWFDPNKFYGDLSDQEDIQGFLYVDAIEVYKGTEDLIWIATTGGIAGGIGVGKYNYNSDNWEWSATTEFPLLFPSHIAADPSSGTVWVADIFIDPNDVLDELCDSMVGFDANKFSQWRPDISDPNFRIWSPDGGIPRKKSPEEKTNYKIRAMIVDGDRNLWLGTEYGLYKISIDDLLNEVCNFDLYDPNETGGGLPSGSIYDLMIDPEDANKLWISTDSGVSVYKIAGQKKSLDSWTQYPLTDTLVLKMLPRENGGVYAGTDKGLLEIGWIHYTNPEQGGQFVDLKIDITFIRAMDPDSTEDAFCLQVDNNVPDSPCVKGAFNWGNFNRLLQFTPSAALDSGTSYILTIDETAEDPNGISMSETFTLRFSTPSVQKALTFEGVGCFIQNLEHEKTGIFKRLKDWLNFNL